MFIEKKGVLEQRNQTPVLNQITFFFFFQNFSFLFVEELVLIINQYFNQQMRFRKFNQWQVLISNMFWHQGCHPQADFVRITEYQPAR